MKKKEKPTSVRLGNELTDELGNRCSNLGCSKSDFIKNAVEFMITNESDFDFGDEEEEIEEEPKEPAKISVTRIPDEPKSFPVMHGKILDDYGNIIGSF